MLTVLLATKNRSTVLRSVLESYCELKAPEHGWKVVVVDNGSADATRSVIQSFNDRLPITYVYEPKPGKNCALNAGLELVEGDLTVLTDDDAFPAPGWLVELRRVADSQPEYSIFGGPVTARWEVPPPPWIKWVNIGPMFTITPSWMKDGELPARLVSMVQGPNMAIRTNIFRSGIRFDTTIGPSGVSYAMGSETELLLRLSRHGHRAWHVQTAVVEHFVRKEQLEKAWILSRAIRWGRGYQRLWPSTRLWFGIPRYLFRDIPKEVFRTTAALVCLREEAAFRSRWQLNFLLGVGIESRFLASKARVRAAAGSGMKEVQLP